MSSLLPFFILLALSVIAPHTARAEGEEFHNDFESELNFECPDHQIISSIASVHNNTINDRKWRFACRQPPSGATPGRCTWSDDYVNRWGETISFLCPPNWVLTGVKSIFTDSKRDRRWNFKCCKDSVYLTYACELTPYLNTLHKAVDYTVPNAHVLTGWFSMFTDSMSDRRLKVTECSYKQLVTLD